MPKPFVLPLLLVAFLSVVSIAPIAWAQQPASKTTAARASVVLERPAVVEFEQAKLVQVLDWLRTTHGLKVLVDRGAITGEGLSTDMSVDIKVRHLPLKTALQL